MRKAEMLSKYYFRINHCQAKANRAIDALSKYSKQNAKEKSTLQANNIKILHRLQSSRVKVSDLAKDIPFSLYQVKIFEMAVMLQLRQLEKFFKNRFYKKKPYIISMRAIQFRLAKLQNNNVKVEEI